jgi:anaerobic selenocysteine-containing dehydrogenase
MWCHSHCIVAVEVRNDRLMGISSDESSRRASFYSSIMKPCLRRIAAMEWFYHPDRLNFPVKRAGDRGENKWKQISWEQALDEIADKIGKTISEYGPETLASARGTGRTCDEYRGRFHNLLGSPNIIGAPNICYGPTSATSNAIIGWATWPFPSPKKTGALLLIGANRYSYPDVWKRFLQVKESGAKLIVVGPRKTEAAEHTDRGRTHSQWNS